MHYFGWNSKILPEFSTCVELEVGSHQRQVHDRLRGCFVSKLELAWFPIHRRELSTYNRWPYFLGDND
jgi:hypothetical protein